MALAAGTAGASAQAPRAPGPFGLEACPQGSLPEVSAPESSGPTAEATGGGLAHPGPRRSRHSVALVAPVTAASVFPFSV